MKEKADSDDTGKGAWRDAKLFEDNPKKGTKLGGRVGRGFMGLERGGRGRDGEERERLVVERGQGVQCGYGSRRHAEGEGECEYGYGYGYGHYEGMMYPAAERGRYSDAVSESASSGCVGIAQGHREDCVGECGTETRRRSRES